MIVLVFAALIGGFGTLAVFWPYGAFTALVAAPFGGSLLALVAGLLLASLPRRTKQSQEHNAQPFLQKKTAA